MIKLYLDTAEHVVEDMLLNESDRHNIHFICNDAIEDIDQDRIDIGQNYGFRVHYGFNFFHAMQDRVLSLIEEQEEQTICVDNLSNWLLGIDSEANSVEYMYTEETVGELKNFIYTLLKATSTHNISILCNEYMLQYLIDTLHMNHYVIID